PDPHLLCGARVHPDGRGDAVDDCGVVAAGAKVPQELLPRRDLALCPVRPVHGHLLPVQPRDRAPRGAGRLAADGGEAARDKVRRVCHRVPRARHELRRRRADRGLWRQDGLAAEAAREPVCQPEARLWHPQPARVGHLQLGHLRDPGQAVRGAVKEL
ncbi:hypothetical protein IWQ56_003917, partial [Coemansia nantahalensis]